MEENTKYLDGFEKYNRSKSLSPKIIEHHMYVIEEFSKKVAKDFKAITKAGVEKYFEYMKNSKYADASVDKYLHMNINLLNYNLYHFLVCISIFGMYINNKLK